MDSHARLGRVNKKWPGGGFAVLITGSARIREYFRIRSSLSEYQNGANFRRYKPLRSVAWNTNIKQFMFRGFVAEQSTARQHQKTTIAYVGGIELVVFLV
jgi:hypothetical protein